MTARLRAENLQDIPLAITSFSEADMRRRQLNNLADVAMQTAGFSFEDFASGAVETPAQYALFGGNAFNLGFTDVIDFNCSGGALWCGELPNNPESVPSENRSLPEPNVDPRSFGQIGNDEIFRASITYELTESLDLFYQYGLVESRVFSGRMSGRDTITGVPDTFILGFLAGNVPFDAQPNGGLQADSHEVRVSFDDGGPVRALIGALYYDSTDFFSNRTYYLPPLGTTPLDQANVTFPATTTILDDETFAIYGSVEYSVDKWTFAAEARYSDEKKRFLQAPDPVSNGPEFFYDLPSVPSEALFEPGNFSFITPRFTVQYQANADSQIYLTAARGAKAGGFNRIVTNFAEEQAYDPEFNWTFEIGSKNTFLDGTLQLNLSAFYIDWTDMQITGRQRDAAITDVNIITNIGGVTTWGVEMEGVWQPVDPLQISFAFSHVAPRVDDGVIFQEAVNGGWCTPDVCDPNGDIGGNTLPRTPVTQATTGIQWTDSLTDTMDYFLRTDISYQGKQYASFLNAGFVGGRTLVNASIGVTADSWDVQIWTRNLLNNEYASSTFFAGNFVYAPVFGERRTAGIMATYSY